MAYTAPTTITRAYVYTYVSDYGEEGPPSAPDTKSGIVGQTWNIALPSPSLAVKAGRALSKKRIYRTVSGQTTTASYYLVDEVDIDTAAYDDSKSDDDLTSGTQLESLGWSPPPSDLKGAVAMPNGIIAAFRDNEVWFCEPYRPHAWPVEYQVSVDYPIVGLGVMGQTLIVCTTGYPWSITGVHPSKMSLAKIEANEPCQSRASIVSSPEGVYYVSPNGLVVAAPGQVRNLTAGLLDPAGWQNGYSLVRMRAVRFNTAYLGIIAPSGTRYRGVLIDSLNLDRVAFTEILDNSLLPTNFQPDFYAGVPLAIIGTNLYVLDPPDGASVGPYVWRSKIFKLPRPDNLGAMKVYFKVPSGAPSLDPVPNITRPMTLGPNMYGIVRVYGGGRLVFEREMRGSGDIFRLPTGFKSDEWQIEIEARVVVRDIQVASSPRELERV